MEYIILNLKSLCAAFLNSIKLSGYKMGIKFDKDLLAVEQNNYLNKIVNVYIVYDVDAWSILLAIANKKIAYLEKLV